MSIAQTQERYNAFHVMTKPSGPICNLDCKYCFYLEKENLYPGNKNFKMPDDVLENYVKQYIQSQNAPTVSFAWQGGEPTLMGLDFFKRVVELQKKYCPPNQKIENALQTNGILVNEDWCQFFKENNFLIGLSIDGPRSLHDKYRVDKGGAPTFDAVMRAMGLLKKFQCEFNTLTVVARHNSHNPVELYRFLRDNGSGFMQFIPLVERVGEGMSFAPPPDDPNAEPSPVTPWSVEAVTYGEFLCAIFDEWVRNDVGNAFVQIFDVQLAIWMGMPSSLCIFSETCGRAMAMEHNGDLYSCDHYVYDRYKLGNIATTPIEKLVTSEQQQKFGNDKRDTLPKYCQNCEVKFACNGECPKHRFVNTPDGEAGLNYLCPAYKRFFKHIDPYMKHMAELVKSGRPAANIMAKLAREERALVRPDGKPLRRK